MDWWSGISLMAIKPKPEIDRLMNLCIPEPNSGCWLWLGSIKNSGYGQFGMVSRTTGKPTMVSAHRASYQIIIEDIPPNVVIRHSCDNKLCVNPDHLLCGTQQDNIDDMHARGRNYWGAQRTCKNGHPFNEENARPRKKGERARRCITCAREASKRFYYKRNTPC